MESRVWRYGAGLALVGSSVDFWFQVQVQGFALEVQGSGPRQRHASSPPSSYYVSVWDIF